MICGEDWETGESTSIEEDNKPMATNQALYAATITITTTRQNILTLLRATNAKNADCPGASRGYQMQPDPVNVNNILIGDENVLPSPQSCMLNMVPGSGFYDSASIPGVAPLGSFWAVTAAGTALLNIGVFGE